MRGSAEWNEEIVMVRKKLFIVIFTVSLPTLSRLESLIILSNFLRERT